MNIIARNKKKIIIVSLMLLAFALAFLGRPFPKAKIEYGVTFSNIFAKQLNGDWQATYIAILDDLKARKIRLVSYWDQIEMREGAFDFSELDWQMIEAGKRNAEVVLVVGLKAPRWPECHIPEWVALLSKEDREAKLLAYIEAVVNRYKTAGPLMMWQVENEPFLGFGEGCPKTDSAFLDREVALVHSLDSRPVLVTDSGEIGRWVPAARVGDVFGTTMYFQIQKDGIGQFRYPIPAAFFRAKRRITDILAGDKPKIIIEFQMEPWNKKQVYETPLQFQLDTFNQIPFDERIEFVGRTGFDTVYMWGAEWWYWLKETHQMPENWNKAKELFKEL